MPSIGAHCHELRIRDQSKDWRVIYHFDDNAIVILDVFQKTTKETPKSITDICRR
jgi:phage-related protein